MAKARPSGWWGDPERDPVVTPALEAAVEAAYDAPLAAELERVAEAACYLQPEQERLRRRRAIAAVDALAAEILGRAVSAGLEVASQRSRLSEARYLTVRRQDAPRLSLRVRVAAHAGYGDGSTPDVSIRTDGDIVGVVEALAVAEALIAALADAPGDAPALPAWWGPLAARAAGQRARARREARRRARGPG